MRPLAGEATLALVVTVVAGEYDDGVVGQTCFLKIFDDTVDDAVDASNHAVIGAEVGGVFFRCVPAPEKSDSVHRLFHELRVVFKNLRVGQSRLLDRDVLVKSIDRLGPREVSDAGALVAVLGVGGVKTDREAERATALVLVDELDRPVACQLALVPERAVGLFLEIRAAADRLKGVEHRLTILLVHVHTKLSDEAGLVTCLSQQYRIAELSKLAVNRSCTEGKLVRPLVQTGQDRGSTGRTDGGGHEHIAEPYALLGQAIQGWRFQKRMAGTAQAVPAVVVGQEEKNIGPNISLGQGNRRGSKQNGENGRQPRVWSSHVGRSIGLAKRLAKRGFFTFRR